MTSYAFANENPLALDRHKYLAAMLNADTYRRIRGLGSLDGKRVLELGAGGGSIAAWLAKRVDTYQNRDVPRVGRVLATDLDTRHLREADGYEVLRHDLVHDPIPDGPWDIVHARLLLMHLPERREILERLAAALAPGGQLLIEDWYTAVPGYVLRSPDAASGQLVERYFEVLTTTVLAAAGTRPTWAGEIYAAMVEVGLADVDARISARSWPGGTPGALLIENNVRHLNDELLAAGFQPDELQRLCQLAHDERFVVRGHLLISVKGRRAT